MVYGSTFFLPSIWQRIFLLGMLLQGLFTPVYSVALTGDAFDCPANSKENLPVLPANDVRYYTSTGRIEFSSEAPLEIIKGWSDELRGVLESSGAFAFSVSMNTFQGFNSGLQQEHFKENYLEIDRFPKAVFEGQFIELPNLSTPGTYQIRVRGRLEIHGISRERILPGTLQVEANGSISINTQFQIPLQDHDIGIPKIMHQKIAEAVSVTVKANLRKP